MWAPTGPGTETPSADELLARRPSNFAYHRRARSRPAHAVRARQRPDRCALVEPWCLTLDAVSEAIATFTQAEYLALEQRSNLRHEFVGGRIHQMAGGTERHELAIAALVRHLYPAARAARCRVFANRQLRVPAGDH